MRYIYLLLIRKMMVKLRRHWFSIVILMLLTYVVVKQYILTFQLKPGSNAPTQKFEKFKTFRRKSNESRFSADENLLSLPGIYNYLPHLLDRKDALTPIIHASNRRKHNATMALGIPTVHRPKSSYLLNTLRSLISGLTLAEKDDVLIIVFIGETNFDYVTKIYTKIANTYPNELQSGLLEVIAPSPNFYPKLDDLPETLGDPKSRVKWRAKQNLDYAFLMMYAQRRAMFYVQLEDDLIAKPSYVSTMKAFALQQHTNTWLMIEFSSLGFIGKLFRSSDLVTLVEFFLMFYKDKPNDWLLDYYFEVRVCNPEKDSKHCRLEKQKVRIKVKPSLFQHVGKESSLKGKTQKLIDKDFSKVTQFKSHLNPKANVLTTFREYQQFKAERAYLGHTFFWGKTPVKDSVIRVCFSKPELLDTFLFRSGNVEHPGDILINSTVEVLTQLELNTLGKNHTLIDEKHYIKVGSFDSKGLAEGFVPRKLGPIAEIRIRVLQDMKNNWVIISEFFIVRAKMKKTKALNVMITLATNRKN